MKKVLFIVGIAVVSLSSCVKDYTCKLLQRMRQELSRRRLQPSMEKRMMLQLLVMKVMLQLLELLLIVKFNNQNELLILRGESPFFYML